MSIEVLTTWYNEEFLAPFFLRHYGYADTITIFLDQETTDATASIAASYANVRIIPFRFPAGFNAYTRQKMVNAHYAQSRHDWVLCVDADEFVFYKTGPDEFHANVRPFLREHYIHDFFVAQLYTVYPHISERPLDASLPAVPQRRHGNPVVEPGYAKPLLVRGGLNVEWWVGAHQLLPSTSNVTALAAPVQLLGAHWNKADPDFALERILRNRVPRISDEDKHRNFSTQYYHVTEEELRQEFAEHQNDPQIF